MNKDLFIKIFKNKVLAINICKKVNEINRSESFYSFGWEELQKRFTLLIKLNYVDQFRLYLERYQQTRVKEVDSFSIIYYQSIMTAIRYAKIDILRVITEHFNLKLSDYVKPTIMMRQASLSGSLEMLQYLDLQTTVVTTQWQVSDYIEAFTISPISDNSDLQVVKWLYEKVRAAEAINSVEKEMYIKGVYESTAKKGRVDIFKWLMEQPDLKINNYQSLIQVACINGNITFLNYLLDNHSDQIEFNRITIDLNEIAKNLSKIIDPLEIVKWVHQHFKYFISSTDLMDSALKIDCLELIKWLRANRTEGFSDSGMEDLFECSLETLNWIQMNATERFSTEMFLTTETIENAGFDSLEKLQWLHENSKIAFTENTIENAVFSGEFESIKYLHSVHPNLFTQRAMNKAVRSNNFEMVKWFHENRTEGFTSEAIDLACENNNLEMVRWLNENINEGASLLAVLHSITNNNIEMFKYLMENVFSATTIIDDDNHGDADLDKDERFIYNSETITTCKEMSQCFYKLLKKHYSPNYKLGIHHVSYIKELATRKNCFDLIRDFYELGNFFNETVVYNNDMPIFYASMFNRLDIVKYFINVRNDKWTSSHFSYAYGNGHFEVCDFFFENTLTSRIKTIMDKNDCVEFMENYQYIVKL
ncbi:hypothetical protein PPL_10795 [Heterostelium album PN500]|uniref:Uncharacterized protein n=1 Tax=Heterostelium pallidum (strain ATCC 26659 / Pp 5 / PN500) TaxID=670386 RepID=D3BS05_HETP5|nr:hypothetical protein PPL_10795 [Heterostelium album PN500]EFA75742.1 hypothetical protein PPL_10795 [Heterostelium album PN500]|eukprot:XP_020427876.1 hypothetical protein PPL_10795 [Heterostelium album PN500]